MGFPGGASGREPTCQCRRHKRCGFDPWVGKIPWRRAWQPTPVVLPEESPWTEESGELQSRASHSVGHDCRDWAHMRTRLCMTVCICLSHTCIYTRCVCNGYSNLSTWCAYVCAQSLSSVWLFWDPMDCSLPGSSVCGIIPATVLEWVAISFSRWLVKGGYLEVAALFAILD